LLPPIGAFFIFAGLVLFKNSNNNTCALLLDRYGMSKYDLLAVGKIILANPGEFARLPETLVQGFVGKAAALRTIVSSVASDPSLVFNGIRILERHDDTTVGYYGNSQGGVVGGGYLSFSPDFLRGVLGSHCS
jgi:hypothetical protein